MWRFQAEMGQLIWLESQIHQHVDSSASMCGTDVHARVLMRVLDIAFQTQDHTGMYICDDIIVQYEDILSDTFGIFI